MLLSIFSASIYAQGFLISEYSADVDIIETIILNNGNRLNFAFDNLDNNTAESSCQCEEYSFGEVLWVFESNNDFEIINQKCFKEDDLSSLFYIDLPISPPNSGAINTVYDNREIWNSCAPKIRDVFYLDDEIFVHFLEDYAGTSGFYQPTGASQLLKFDLTEFEFFDPINYPTNTNPTVYGVIDKTLKLNESDLMHLKYDVNVSASDNASELIELNGYQKFYAQDDIFYQLEVSNPSGSSFLDISEIYEANTDVIILNYKKNNENKISFLILTNALDGLYTEGEQYETSLFLIEVDFTNISNLVYNVIKSDLEFPRNDSPKYVDYNTFIDNENNFVFNVKPQTAGDEDLNFYDKIHILKDNGEFEAFSIENQFSYQYQNSNGLDVSIGNNPNGSSAPHKLIDIAFSESNFLTLEEVPNYSIIPGGTYTLQVNPSKVIKLFDKDGNVLFRHIFGGNCGPVGADETCFSNSSSNLVSDRFQTYVVEQNTYLHWNFGNQQVTDINFYGVNFNESIGYTIDNSDNYNVCSPANEYGSERPLWSLTFNDILSTNNFLEHSLEFRILNNPVVDELIVVSENKLDISIFNIMGQKLIETKNINSINVSNLSKGLYLIKATDGNNSSTKKFIKI